MICHVIPGKICARSECRGMLNILKVACLGWLLKLKDFHVPSFDNWIIIYFQVLLFIFQVLLFIFKVIVKSNIKLVYEIFCSWNKE